MTVKEIVRKYLIKNGFDGLCCDECGCGVDHLIPCFKPTIEDCVAAYKHKCDCSMCDAECNSRNENDFCYRADLPRG
jgi:hypothetical protein